LDPELKVNLQVSETKPSSQKIVTTFRVNTHPNDDETELIFVVSLEEMETPMRLATDLNANL
jgi:hypothetical protein